MKYVIILRKRDDFCDILAQNLYYEHKLVLISLHDVRELSQWLSDGKKPELVIGLQKELAADNITKYFEKVNPGPIFHFYTDSEEQTKSKDCFYFPESSFELETVIENTMIAFPASAGRTKEEVPDYVSFSIQYFYNVKSFVSDIYIMLKKKDSIQYVKRINAGEEIDRATLEKYQDSGLENLYIKKAYRFHFINLAVDQSIEDLRSPKEKTILNAADENYQLTAEMLLNMGITENTIKLTKASIVSMKQTLKSMNSVSSLLEKLLLEKLSYAYKRTHMTAMFCVEALKRVDWFSKEQMPALTEQMVFAVFLHDILLIDEKLLKIHSKLDMYESSLSEKEKELVLNHANLISSLVQKYPKSPAFVDVIIKLHHGTTNGVGFSENLNSSLLKQVIILIVVEKFVIRILNFNKEKEKLIDIIEDCEREFSLPSYAKVMAAVKETILDSVRSK